MSRDFTIKQLSAGGDGLLFRETPADSIFPVHPAVSPLIRSPSGRFEVQIETSQPITGIVWTVRGCKGLVARRFDWDSPMGGTSKHSLRCDGGATLVDLQVLREEAS